MAVLFHRISDRLEGMRGLQDPTKKILKSTLSLIIITVAIFFRSCPFFAFPVIAGLSFCQAILTEPDQRYPRIYEFGVSILSLSYLGLLGSLELVKRFQWIRL